MATLFLVWLLVFVINGISNNTSNHFVWLQRDQSKQTWQTLNVFNLQCDLDLDHRKLSHQIQFSWRCITPLLWPWPWTLGNKVVLSCILIIWGICDLDHEHKPIFLQSVLTHDDALQCQLWLQKVESFLVTKGWELQRIPSGQHLDRQKFQYT